MSAFVVEKGTIDRIVTYVEGLYKTHPYLYQRVAEVVGLGDIVRPTKATGSIRHAVNLPTILGQRLWETNVGAVNLRYATDDTAPQYHWSSRTAAPIVVLKSLQCFLYQCCEGDVPESTLSRVVEAIKNDVAEEICTSLPEYKQAPWE